MFPSIRRLLGMGFQATERVHPALVQSRTLEIITYPRTMLMTHADTSPCLYPSMPGEHLLKCGHSINTTLPEPCGRNCQHIGNAIADPEGFEGAKERVGFYCQACVEEVIEMKVQKYTNPRERSESSTHVKRTRKRGSLTIEKTRKGKLSKSSTQRETRIRPAVHATSAERMSPSPAMLTDGHSQNINVSTSAVILSTQPFPQWAPICSKTDLARLTK